MIEIICRYGNRVIALDKATLSEVLAQLCQERQSYRHRYHHITDAHRERLLTAAEYIKQEAIP